MPRKLPHRYFYTTKTAKEHDCTLCKIVIPKGSIAAYQQDNGAPRKYRHKDPGCPKDAWDRALNEAAGLAP